MPPKATPGPTWPYQCTLDKSQLAKGINSSHGLLSKVFRSKFSPKILITFSSHRDVGFNCVSPVCSHCCSLNCIHRMFCLSVACSTFHCPSPPIPSHFPALNTSQCILHTADGALHPSCTAHCSACCCTPYTPLPNITTQTSPKSTQCSVDTKLFSGQDCRANLQYQRSFQAIPSSAKVMQSTAELAVCPLHSFSPVHWV